MHSQVSENLKLTWNRAKTYVIMTVLLAFVCAYTAVFFLGRPGRTVYIIFIPQSAQVNFDFTPYLHIDVSPMGYPIIGQSWTIHVYVGGITQNRMTFSPSSNSTVVVTVNCEGSKRDYNLSVNANGEALFAFLPEYSDVAFQAFNGKLSSEKLVVSTHYVSSGTLDLLVGVGGLMTGVSTCGGILTFRNTKAKRMLKICCLVILCLIAVVSVLSSYARLFQETVWGYPENVIDGIITLTLLKYATCFSMPSSFLIVVLAFVFRASRSNEETCG